MVTGVPGGHKTAEIFLKTGVLIVDIQPHDMHVLSLVLTGKFNAGNHLRDRGGGRDAAFIRHCCSDSRCLVKGSGNVGLWGMPAKLRGIVQGLRKTVHRVMVRQSKGRQALFSGIVHQLGGGIGSVGTGGMYV